MTRPSHPPVVGDEVLLRRAERLAAEARQCGDLAEPNAMLLALTLREQLAQVINELAGGCAVMANDMAAFKLRQTATAAYGAMVSNGRTRK